MYYAEVNGVNVYGRAYHIDTDNLGVAKRIASRRQVFQGTVLYIGTAPLVDRYGYEYLDWDSALAWKKDGKWHDMEGRV